MALHAPGRSAIVVIVLLAALMGAAVRAQPTIDNGFLVTNVRVFDGRQTLQNTHVAVTGGVIRAIGGDVAAWKGLPVVDGTDSTLLPGLIDAHVHVRVPAELRQALRFGVTTALDMATVAVTPGEMAAIRGRANAAHDMADVRTAGFPATSPRGHMTEYGRFIPTVSTATVVGEFVAMRREEGSDYLKIVLNGVRSATSGMSNLDERSVRALVDAAHAAGMLAVAHVETLDDVNIAVAAGVDGLAHVWRRGGANPEVARHLAERKVFVVPTLVVMDGFLPEGRASLLADQRFQNVMSSSIKEHLRQSLVMPAGSPDTLRARVEAQRAAVRVLHEAGVRLLVGSDPPGAPAAPTAHGISVHRELELLVGAGLTPSEALAAASANAAEAFRLIDRGRILPGRRADMLLVRGDPTTDLYAVRDIVRVWKAGVEVDRTVAER